MTHQFSQPLNLHPDMPQEMQQAVNDLAYAIDKFLFTIEQIEKATETDPRNQSWGITFVGALGGLGHDGHMIVKESVVGSFPDVISLLARTQLQWLT